MTSPVTPTTSRRWWWHTPIAWCRPTLRRVGKIRAERLVDEARLYHDPDRALDDELQALAERKVELLPGRTPLTTDVHLRLDTHDAQVFDAAVSRGAAALKQLGDLDPLDVRRARAVGVLADQQRALDLFAGRAPGRTPTSPTLVLHLDADQLDRLATDPEAGPVVLNVEGGPSPGPGPDRRPPLDGWPTPPSRLCPCSTWPG